MKYTPDQQAELVNLYQKCKDDYIYACPRILKIRTKDGKLVPLNPYPFQEKFLKDRSQKRAVLKGRQEGFSTIVLAEHFLDTLFNPQVYALTIVPDDDAAENLFRIINRFYDNLHPELQSERPKKYSTKKLIEYRGHDSVIAIQTAGKKNLGRSYTWNRVHVTEVDHIQDFAQMMLGLKDSVDPKTGKWVYETTANGINSPMHNISKAVKDNESDFSYHFVPWTRMETYRIGDDGPVGEDGLMENQRKWREQKIKQYMDDGLSESDAQNYFRQEYPQNDTECFIVSGGSVFDKQRLREDLSKAKSGEKGDVLLVEKDGEKEYKFIKNSEGYLQIWKHPEPGWKNRYIVGVDVAEGIEVVKGTNDRDYSVIEVFDRIGESRKLEQVAEWRDRVDAVYLTEVLHAILKYYNNPFTCVESNSDGVVVNRYLLDKYRYTNVYHRRVLSQDYDMESKSVGFKTHRGTRPVLISEFLKLYNSANESDIVIRSRALLEEMHTFIRDSKGVPRGASGCHDDLVMSTALTVEALTQAPMPKNLKVERERRITIQKIMNRKKTDDLYNSNFNHTLVKKYF